MTTFAETMSEADLQQRILTYAHMKGWLQTHVRAARKVDGKWHVPITGDPGWPDIVLARNGQVVIAELKAQNGRLHSAQKVWLAALTNTEPSWWTDKRTDATVTRGKLTVAVWRPADLAAIERLLY